MSQSRVEIKHYSIAYFNCVSVFKVLEHRTLVVGGAHTHCVDAQIPDISNCAVCMSPALNGSFVLQCFECGRNKQRNDDLFLPGTATRFFQASFWS